MGAFIVAGLVFIATVAISMLVAFASYMSTTGQGGQSPVPIFIGGSVAAIAIAATHWLPPIGW